MRRARALLDRRAGLKARLIENLPKHFWREQTERACKALQTEAASLRPHLKSERWFDHSTNEFRKFPTPDDIRQVLRTTEESAPGGKSETPSKESLHEASNKAGYDFSSLPLLSVSRSRWCGLPDELLLKIADHLEGDDLISFRVSLGWKTGNVYEDYIQEILRRVTSIPKSQATDEDVAEVVEQAVRTLKLKLHDPCEPGPFRTAALKVGSLRDEIDRLFRDYSDSSAPRMDDLLRQLQGSMDVAFTLFAECLGLEPKNTLRFEKKIADECLKSAIGAVGEPGMGVFAWPGCKSLSFSNPVEAAKAFSLYMARKSFVVVDPRKNKEATSAFYERVTSPRPPLSPLRAFRLQQMLKLIDRISDVFFDKPKNFVPRAPNSGKACLELPRSKGGKRQYLFSADGERAILMRGKIRPDTIYTGGKFRTITVGSVFNERWAFLNEYMFSRLRKCAWVISGTTVKQWAEQCVRVLDEDETFCSGDLRAATDMFFGDFAETVLRRLAVKLSIDEDSLNEIFGMITRCKFYEPDESGAYVFVRQQRYGQMMGSDFSFPILVLVTFVIGLESKNMVDTFLSFNNKKLKEAVLKYDEMGVNGDDYVSWGKTDHSRIPSDSCAVCPLRTEGERWADTVPTSGGVPEPSKSPCDRFYFTVNSQLWTTIGGIRDVGTILPSMILGLNSKAHKVPNESWLTILESPLWQNSEKVRETLELDVCLLPEVPRSWGGLGLDVPCRSTRTLVHRLLYARESLGLQWLDMDKIEVPLARRDAVRMNASGCLVGAEFLPDEELPDRKISGYVPKAQIKRVIERRFGHHRAVAWSKPDVHPPSFSLLKFAIKYWTRALYQDGNQDKLVLAAMREKSYERSGLAFVHDFVLRRGDPEFDPLPYSEDVFLFRRRSPYHWSKTTCHDRIRHDRKKRNPNAHPNFFRPSGVRFHKDVIENLTEAGWEDLYHRGRDGEFQCEDDEEDWSDL